MRIARSSASADAVARAAACEFLSAVATVGADHRRLEPRGSDEGWELLVGLYDEYRQRRDAHELA